MLNADKLSECKKLIDNKWVIARPLGGPFLWRLWDAWQVIRGKADAVFFYKQ